MSADLPQMAILIGGAVSVALIALGVVHIVFRVPWKFNSPWGRRSKRVIHFPKGPSGPSQTHEWKLKTIEKLSKKKGKHKLEFIWGECKDVESIRIALEKGFDVEGICGPKAFDEDTKTKLAGLVKLYGGNINIYIISKRPPRHSLLIDDRYLLLEDRHKDTEYFKLATIIEDAYDEITNRFHEQFNRLRGSGVPATPEQILKMPTYNDMQTANEQPDNA
ncbi:MAG: hypothetical protein JW986_03215 [Methanotrichaceae archaeon]|nr:hypothetical protein [Methanotrichaceae archaeon]